LLNHHHPPNPKKDDEVVISLRNHPHECDGNIRDTLLWWPCYIQGQQVI
jgi:hypothetical protein